jgi:hypothetical protein
MDLTYHKLVKNKIEKKIKCKFYRVILNKHKNDKIKRSTGKRNRKFHAKIRIV